MRAGRRRGARGASCATSSLALRDPDERRGASCCASTAPRTSTARSARAEGPDLIVGYDRGYGASDESTLGEITEAVLEDNTSRWSGNHLMAPEVVPGILLANRKLAGSGYDLTDLTVTLLAYYGIEPAPGYGRAKPISADREE